MGKMRFALIFLFLCAAGSQTLGQSPEDSSASNQPKDNSSQSGTSASPPKDPAPPQVKDERPLASAAPGALLKNFALDQKIIWTSPFRARTKDLNWIVPLAGITAGMINADAELSNRIDTTSTFSKHASTISNAGAALAIGGTSGLWVLGKMRSDERQQETGILGGEAVLNSLVVTEVLKLATQRARPSDGNFKGEFFNSSSITNSSFPSLHAMATWSAISVLTHEYPGPLTKFLGYGLATGVSVARVTGKNHFTSDVIVGSALGWLIGTQVYDTHHNPELPGGNWGTFERGHASEGTASEDRGTPYVPLDSWVYPAMYRLAGLGAIESGFLGLRPWTRKECARLLEEASNSVDENSGDEASRLYSALAAEFAPELTQTEKDNFGIDSVYTRITGISGQPLTDGYHFGQTIVNDFGRPFQSGTNAVAGFSSSGSAGMLAYYVRGEYEHAPSAPGVSQAVQDQIQIADQKPVVQPASPIPAFSQFRLLDSYLSWNLSGVQLSFGKQTLWTSPTSDPFLWSNNAEPMYMFRLDQSTPSKLPSFLGYLGPFRTLFWVGKLTGQHYVNTQDVAVGNVVSLGRTLSKQPMVNGVKINFKPTPNFEFGVGRTGLWGGPDFPITFDTTRRSFISTSNATGRGFDPGDRRSTFDFSYRLPGMRSLMLYEDSIVEDEVSPIGYPRRSAHTPGLYLSTVPFIPHLDARLEASYTNLPGLIQPPAGGFFYWNTRYLDGYTNDGVIIGDGTVGRQGISLRAESTYWFASDKTVQLGYRSNIADSMFLQGGNLRDIFLRSEWRLSSKLSLSSFLQYEYWNFPLLSAGNKKNNFTTSFQLTYWPHWRLKGGS